MENVETKSMDFDAIRWIPKNCDGADFLSNLLFKLFGSAETMENVETESTDFDATRWIPKNYDGVAGVLKKYENC